MNIKFGKCFCINCKTDHEIPYRSDELKLVHACSICDHENRCKDCHDPADPASTVTASELGVEGPDIFFCEPCKTFSQKLLDRLLNKIKSGEISLEQAERAVISASPS